MLERIAPIAADIQFQMIAALDEQTQNLLNGVTFDAEIARDAGNQCRARGAQQRACTCRISGLCRS